MADLMYSDVVEKFTSTTFTYIFDFAGHMIEGRTLSSAVTTATRNDGTDSTSTIITSTTDDNVSLATVTITTSTTEASYLIKCVGTDSASGTVTLTMLLNIRAPQVLV